MDGWMEGREGSTWVGVVVVGCRDGWNRRVNELVDAGISEWCADGWVDGTPGDVLWMQ